MHILKTFSCVLSGQCKKSSDDMDLLKGRGSLGVRQDSETILQPCIPEDGAQDENDFVCCSNRWTHAPVKCFKYKWKIMKIQPIVQSI